MLWSFLSSLARGLLAWRPPAPPPVTDGKLEGAELVRLIGREDPVILDIGCNDGFHTNWFLELFAQARVYSFEPDPRAAQSFRRVVQSKRAKLYELAIAGRDGTAEFHASDGLPDPGLAETYPEGWHQSGSIRRPDFARETPDPPSGFRDRPPLSLGRAAAKPVRSLAPCPGFRALPFGRIHA